MSGQRRELQDPTQELKQLAVNAKVTDDDAMPRVCQLLRDGANSNAKLVDDDGDKVPMLHSFLSTGRVKCAAELIKAGADVNKTDFSGLTPLQFIVYRGELKEDIIVKAVHILLVAGADVNANSYSNVSPIHTAVTQQLFKTVKALIRHAKERIDFEVSNEDKFGKCLAVAAAFGNEEMVRDLIAAGAKLESKRKEDEATPLLVAAEHGQTQCVKILIDAGAKLDAVTSPTKKAALHLAAIGNHASTCKLLLEQESNPFKVTSKMANGQTPVELAVEGHCDEAAEVLYAYSFAQMLPRPKYGHVFVDALIPQGRLAMFKLLVRETYRFGMGSAPFRLAVLHQQIEILDYLLREKGKSLSVDLAEDLKSQSNSDKIKSLLENWININKALRTV